MLSDSVKYELRLCAFRSHGVYLTHKIPTMNHFQFVTQFVLFGYATDSCHESVTSTPIEWN